MAQVPIINGVYTDQNSDFRTSYPRNLVPVPKAQGISEGYLRPAEGLEVFSTSGPGVDRGGILWNSVHYRVMGSKLVSVSDSGIISVLADVGLGSDRAVFDYSFDRLGVVSNNVLYYWNGVLTQVIDPDIGLVKSMIFLDGYFVTTDGTNIIVTELTDPTQVNPIKYGTAETDPDPIFAVQEVRRELNAVGRYSIEVFQNIGGDFFPFQRVDGARVSKGAIGRDACCVFQDSLAFIGSGRNETPSVYLAYQGVANKIATREIEQILSEYSEADLASAVLETRAVNVNQLIYMHLPDQTLVYDAASSQVLQQPVWFTLTSSVVGKAQYRAIGWVWTGARWVFGDPQTTNLGKTSNAVSSHYGEMIGWDFQTQILYVGPDGAIINRIELVALPGRVNFADDPIIWTSYSINGLTFSMEKAISTGKIGAYDKRLVWRNQGLFKNWRTQKFRGTSDSHLSIARLEMDLEPLSA